jgi:hypothetical protein
VYDWSNGKTLGHLGGTSSSLTRYLPLFQPTKGAGQIAAMICALSPLRRQFLFDAV